MKTVLQCAALFVVMLIGWPGYAVERLVLYDDFNTEYIDPGKWFGGEFSPAFPSSGHRGDSADSGQSAAPDVPQLWPSGR